MKLVSYNFDLMMTKREWKLINNVGVGVLS